MNPLTFSGNWVDLVIILILLFFALQAWERGLWVTLSGLLSFIGSLIISLALFTYPAQFLRGNFALSHGISKALGFLAISIVSEAVLGSILINLSARLPKGIRSNPIARILAVAPGIGEGLVLVAVAVLLIMAAPLKPSFKEDVGNSKIATQILARASGLEAKISEVFGGVIDESLTYLTIKPESHESVPLTVNRLNLSEDTQAEQEMFTLVNKERKERGLRELEWAPEIVPVARAHARDMWERKYFSHVSPEGESVGDRLNKADIDYSLAGENLALAPTTQTAHTGLMNSEGHRANILESEFRKIGIGAIDNGAYGKMYVQVFTD